MFSAEHIQAESERLYQKLEHVGFGRELCRMFAPLTLEINALKREKKAVILAHSYQTPDILYGIADFQGDSFQLSREAQKTDAEVIVFCGVKFMAETAKILNPRKKVLLPAPSAGCSLADAIKAEDVRALKLQHPGVPVITYVNTSAEVKAESDACCTSANALQIIESFADESIIFIPDRFMAANLQKMTRKKLIAWHGSCIVHEDFKAEKIARFRQKYVGVRVLAHTECPTEVVEAADFTGGTNDMMRYVREVAAPSYMLVTECGLSDRMRVEFPDKDFLGMCGLCPYMKQNTLALILSALKNPRAQQIITIEEPVRVKAERALKRMFELSEGKRLINN